MVKGFKKDGKFRPTEKRTKSGLKKSDVRKNIVYSSNLGGRDQARLLTQPTTSSKGKKYNYIEALLRNKQSFDKMRWNLVFDDGSDWGFQTNNKKEAERAIATWNENNGSGTGRMIKIQEQEVVTRTKSSLDETMYVNEIPTLNFDAVDYAEQFGKDNDVKNIKQIMNHIKNMKDGDSNDFKLIAIKENENKIVIEPRIEGRFGTFTPEDGFTVKVN